MKIFTTIALVIFLTVASYAQHSVYAGKPVQNASGRGIPASIIVCTKTATGFPCSPTATIYTVPTPPSDPTTGTSIPGSIFSTDANGNYAFGCDPGVYLIQITVPGLTYNLVDTCPGVGSPTSGLTDPGSNGVLKRTALNVTAIATSADLIALWTGTCNSTTFFRADGSCQTVGSAQIYPGVGIANSTGSAWATSYTVGLAANNIPQIDASARLLDANEQVQGISFTDPSITQGGTPGSTTYFYCVVATDTYSHTRSTCFNTALGNATLTGSNFNTITIGAYSSSFPYVLPVGSCNVYRITGGVTQGKIGTIASCASGGSLNDTGLAGDATSPPVDTSGVIAATGLGYIGQTQIVSDESGMAISGGTAPGGVGILAPGYTHSVLIGGGIGAPFTNSGITSVGWDTTGNAHACTSIGYGINCNNDSGVLVGIGAVGTGGTNDVIVGSNAIGNGSSSVSIGAGASATLGQAIAIGKGSASAFTNSIAIGFNSATTAINQVVLGGPNITDIFPGSVNGNGGTANTHGLSGILSGNWGCFSVTPVTVSTNTTNDQNLMACSVPAAVLNRVGETLRIHTKSVYSTPAASVATLTFKAKLCSVSGCGSGNVMTLVSITSTANAGTITNNNALFDVEASTQSNGATAREEASGDLIIDLAATTTAADTVFGDTNTVTLAGSPSDLDFTGALFLQITVAFSAGSASNSVTERQLVVDSVN